MRVYEFCKEHNISAKDAVRLLQDAGFEIKSHMSALDAPALNFLTNTLEKKEAPKKNPIIKACL